MTLSRGAVAPPRRLASLEALRLSKQRTSRLRTPCLLDASGAVHSLSLIHI